ncbi:hypothetical protein LUZ60_017603 [Juncus effusus]|nr:hypothetical protein LUZ60_017603 [Juncus effusus]
MQKQGLTSMKSLGSFRSLNASGSGASRPSLTPNPKPAFDSTSYESIAKLKLTAERLVKDQASVKTDLEMAHTKLKRAAEQIQTLEVKLQAAVNENAKLKVKQTEDSKLWLGLDSKVSSTNTMCDQLMETLKQLVSQTCKAEEDEKQYEEKFDQNSKAMDELSHTLNELSGKLEHLEAEISIGRKETLNLKCEKEELEKDLMERLQLANTSIQGKDSDIKHLEETIERNKEEIQTLDSRLQTMEKELKLKEDISTNLRAKIESLEREKSELSSQNEALCQKLEKSEAEYRELERSLKTLRGQVIQLEMENRATEAHASTLVNSYNKFYELTQEEKWLTSEINGGKMENMRKAYVQSTEEREGLQVENEGLKCKITEMETAHKISVVERAEECRLVEENLMKMSSDSVIMGKQKVELEKLNLELQEKVKELTDASAVADSEKKELLLSISGLESQIQENQEKVQRILEDRTKEEESFNCEVTKRDKQLEELENEMNQLKIALDEEKQFRSALIEKERELESQKSQIKASLDSTESQLNEAKRQYDKMLEIKQLELSKHLKDLCQKNDQAINEVRKKYESEKVEIVNTEKEKAQKLIAELEKKYEEKLTKNKHESEESLMRIKEENVATIRRLEKEFSEKEMRVLAHHKEELHRSELHAENELRERLSVLRKEHEIQMKSLKMQHEDDCRKLQDELELQKNKEEKQRALLQLQWRVMGENQQGDQEVNSKKEYSVSSKRRESYARRELQHSIISPEPERKDVNLQGILESPIASIMKKVDKRSPKQRKMENHEYVVEAGTTRVSKRRKSRNSSMFVEPNANQKSTLSKTPTASKARKAPPVVSGNHPPRTAIGDLFSEGSLNPYADDPYAFD